MLDIYSIHVCIHIFDREHQITYNDISISSDNIQLYTIMCIQIYTIMCFLQRDTITDSVITDSVSIFFSFTCNIYLGYHANFS